MYIKVGNPTRLLVVGTYTPIKVGKGKIGISSRKKMCNSLGEVQIYWKNRFVG